MNLKLQGRLALVTGSSDGIGKAIATELARQGAHVVVHGRSATKVQAVVEEIAQAVVAAKAGSSDDDKTPVPQVFVCTGDLGSAEGATDVITQVQKIESQLGRPLDILVNNVGMFHVQEFEHISDEQWLDYYQLNTLSGVRLTRHFLPPMLERNHHGRVLFVSSEAGVRGLPHMTAYSVSKGSQITLARSLAERTKGTTVTVNSLLPGPTMTAGVQQYMRDFAASHKIATLDEAVAKYFSQHERTSLLQRFLDPQEIADPAVFLCSPLAAGINGCAQRVEGGIIGHV